MAFLNSPIKSKAGRRGGFYRIAKLAELIGASEAAVIDAARICGRVRYGERLCFPKGIGVDFVQEVQLIAAAERAAAERRAKQAQKPAKTPAT